LLQSGDNASSNSQSITSRWPSDAVRLPLFLFAMTASTYGLRIRYLRMLASRLVSKAAGIKLIAVNPETVCRSSKTRSLNVEEIGDCSFSPNAWQHMRTVGTTGLSLRFAPAADVVEIEHLKIDGYHGRLSRQARRRKPTSFPVRFRNLPVNWAAHRSSGSPELLPLAREYPSM